MTADPRNFKLFLYSFFNWAPRHEDVWGEWRYSYASFDLGTR